MVLLSVVVTSLDLEGGDPGGGLGLSIPLLAFLLPCFGPLSGYLGPGPNGGPGGTMLRLGAGSTIGVGRLGGSPGGALGGLIGCILGGSLRGTLGRFPLLGMVGFPGGGLGTPLVLALIAGLSSELSEALPGSIAEGQAACNAKGLKPAGAGKPGALARGGIILPVSRAASGCNRFANT